MKFSTYRETTKTELPPSLDAGTELTKITSIEAYTFDNKGETVGAMRVTADGKVFRTSSKVIMDILTKYFEKHTEPLENVKVVSPRGKRYLTLEGI